MQPVGGPLGSSLSYASWRSARRHSVSARGERASMPQFAPGVSALGTGDHRAQLEMQRPHTRLFLPPTAPVPSGSISIQFPSVG